MIVKKKDITIPVYNSYSNEIIGTIPQASKEDAIKALNSAEKGAEIGKEMSSAQRSEILRKAASLMEREYDNLAKLIATEGIKTFLQAKKEVTRAINTMQLSSEEALRITGSTIAFDSVAGSEDRMGYELKMPIGIILAITPFNDPLNLVCHKLGPAIATGNAVILKPSDYTPLVAIKFGEILYEAGLPKDMLNIITGSPEIYGNTLISDDRVRLISFTGGVNAAKSIQKNAGLKKIVMELGSNSPVIVLDDTDVEEAVEFCVSGAFYASGQNCVGVKRIFVQELIFEEFVKEFCEQTSVLKIGSPMDEKVDVSPIINKDALNSIHDYVTESCASGAKLLVGGKIENNFYLPTILIDKYDNKVSNLKEVFGPVVTISKIENLDQAITYSNISPFGLHAAIFTNDINKANKAAKELNCGGVMINDSTDYRIDSMPFGGVKLSGIGREGVKSSIESMLETKVVCYKLK